MPDHDVARCTLAPDEAAGRARDAQRLAALLRSSELRDGAATLTFGPAAVAAPLVEAFVRAESACCSFFEFAVTSGPDAVVLRIVAPRGATALLEGLVATLDPSADAAGRARLFGHAANRGRWPASERTFQLAGCM